MQAVRAFSPLAVPDVMSAMNLQSHENTLNYLADSTILFRLFEKQKKDQMKNFDDVNQALSEMDIAGVEQMAEMTLRRQIYSQVHKAEEGIDTSVFVVVVDFADLAQ